MKPIGIASMFIVTAVLVGIFSNTVALPTTMRINIYAFIDTQLETSGTSYEPTAKTIVSDAETLLNKLQETSFELRIKATTRLDIQSNGETWMRAEVKKHYGISADLYVIFTSGSLTSAHNDVEGKMCHAQKEFRTIILPGNSYMMDPTRDLVFYSGRLLGMDMDTVGRRTKGGTTDCPLGNMVKDFDYQSSRMKVTITQKWNECNKEELKEFYKKQMANEPRGFCLDKDVTLPNIDIYIDTFYESLTDAHSIKMTKKMIATVINGAKNILNNNDALGTTFELNLIGQDRLDNPPTDFDGKAKISRNKGTAVADFYVFFTFMMRTHMQQFHPQLAGKICSDDRAYRTVSLTHSDTTQHGMARQLAYYIGRTLGMNNDVPPKSDLAVCQLGYMEVLPKAVGRDKVKYKDWALRNHWSQCNAEDLSYFYRQFLRSDNLGQGGKKLCVARRKMILTIGAGYDAQFKTMFKMQVNSEIEAAVKEAENILNQDAPAIGFVFQLNWTIRSYPILSGSEFDSWGGAGDDNNLYIVFTIGKSTTSIYTTARICTATRMFRTILVSYSSQWEYTMGMQVASSIGQLLGMKDDTTGLTAKDGTTCRKGLVVYYGNKWETTSSKWTKCDIEDMWNYYKETIETTGSFCLDRSTFKG